MPVALADLVALAVELFCFALVWCVRALLAAALGVLIASAGHIPYVGDWLRNGLHAIEQAVDNALGKVEHGIGAAVGASWHFLAHLTTWLWDEFMRLVHLGSLLSTVVSELSNGYHWLRNEVLGNTAAHRADVARIKSLEHEYKGIEAKVKTLENDYAHGIGQDVLPRIRTLEREASQIEHVQIPAIQQAEADAASAISNLYDWIRGKASIIGVGTITTAVAAALSALGLDWLRCNNVGKTGSKLCSLASDLLDAILLGTLAVEGSVSLVGMANELVDLSGEIVPAITGFVSEMGGVTLRTAAEQGFG